jgi:hypothetical protein
MTIVAEQLGPELYMACTQNNVAQVQALTSNANSTAWSMASAAIVAASEDAEDVVSYCFRDPNRPAIKDCALRWIMAYEALDPAYRLLVERNFVDVNHVLEMTGTVLGVIAGRSKDKRHGK